MAEYESSGSLRPIPDPTLLTTAQLLREVHTLTAIFEEKIASLGARLDAMDKAQALFQENLTRVPTEVDRAIVHLKELHEAWVGEKFVGIRHQLENIQVQFRERDVRVEQQGRSSETALNAALNAAKEAVNQQNLAFAQSTAKAEAGFVKQMDQLLALFQTATQALDEKISVAIKMSDDKLATVEKQLTMMMGSNTGAMASQIHQQRAQGNTTALVGLIVMGVIAIGSLIVAVLKLSQ